MPEDSRILMTHAACYNAEGNETILMLSVSNKPYHLGVKMCTQVCLIESLCDMVA